MPIPEPQRIPKHATPANLLPVLALFIIFLPFTLETLTGHPHLDLPWPGRQVIPSILFIRGELATDFLSESTNNSVYAISANILSSIFPAKTDQMLAMYDTLSVLLKYTILWISVILLVRFCCFFWISNKAAPKRSLAEIRVVLYTYFTFFSGAIADRLINVKALWIVRPAHVADWNFPISDALNPSGLSFLLIVLALIPCYSSRRLEISAAKNTTAMLTVVFLVFFIASVIHPVVPLFGLGLLLVSWLIFLRIEGIKSRWLGLLLAGSCAWVAAMVCIEIMFPQASISSADFYSIYVEQRHPHHYLPSFYLKASLKLIVLNFIILFGTILLSIRYPRLRPIRTLALASIAVLTAINGIQYFFVEDLHLVSFAALGITRIIGLYEFLYASVIALLFLSALELLRRKTKFLPRPGLTKKQRRFAPSLPSNVWPGTLAVIVIIVLAAGVHFQRVYSSIPNTSERLLQAEFDKNSVPYPRQVLFDDRLGSKKAFNDLREVGNFDVYSDAYFPFSMSQVSEWNNRRLAKLSFLDCLKLANSLASCHLRHQDPQPIYFVSDSDYTGMTPAFNAEINGTEVYVYTL